MLPVCAGGCPDPATCESGRPRSHGAASARGVLRRWMCMARGALGRATACIFLFFRGRRPTRWAQCLARPFHAALHKSIVNNNGNTIARVERAGSAQVGAHRISTRKRPAGGACSAAQAGKEQADNKRTTSRNKTPWNSRAPVGWVGACRSLQIHRPRPSAEPVRSGGSRGARHGQRPPCRPPSRLTESGGRP